MEKRIQAVLNNMKQADLDAMLVTASDAIFYLTGCHIHPGERLLVLLLQPNKKAKLFAPAMFQVGDVDFEVCYYQDHEVPVQLVCDDLIHSGAKAIGVDKEWPARFLLKAMNILPQGKFTEGSFVVDHARVSKDDLELDAMRKASLLNDQVMEEVLTRLKEGNVTEVEMSDFVRTRFLHHGASGNSFDTIACFGKGSSEPHHGCDQTPLTATSGPIIMDMGCVLGGYCSDMTRSYYAGQAPEAYKNAYRAVLDANLAAIASVKPGVPLKEVDAAARDLLVSRGYGQYFVHRTGHGIGINVHEYPDVSSVSEAICQVGMVFSIEPGVYLPGDFGIRIEDLVVVTKEGCEVLNHFPKDLIEIL